MKLFKTILMLVLLLAAVTSAVAWADRGHFHRHRHSHIGVFIGAPLGWPWYYPAPYYYYPPVVAVPSSPPVYIEQGDEGVNPPQQPYYWYHCDNPQGYYPYIRECPAGWQKVVPQPPPS